jgi:hypothetical protein
MHRCVWFTAAVVLVASSAPALDVIADRQPLVAGTSRPSQLWQDPGPNGNNLDGDSVIWTDFTLASSATISHLEWWGAGASELGFRIEVWPQDPNTIAYQPLGVFAYGGNPNVQPTATYTFTLSDLVITAGPGGFLHYSIDLPTSLSLAANDAVNPRWFIDIVGLTHQAYATWNWAQGSTSTAHSFQFLRGGNDGGDLFRSLGDARAISIAGVVPEPMTAALLLLGVAALCSRRTARRCRSFFAPHARERR